jgi:hypothetical protein
MRDLDFINKEARESVGSPSDEIYNLFQEENHCGEKHHYTQVLKTLL